MIKKIRGYEPIKQIGTGGFGEVYVARQDVINREVAIKVILPLYASRNDFIRRFQIEAELVARLEHAHIVPLYDYWRDPDGAFLVMRYIKGGNLADKLVTDGALAMKDAARLLDQIARALHNAHRHRVIHQDIKPANILLDEDGDAYLTDFGIARDTESNVNLAEDESNTMHGSPKYISPEHLRRREITNRSDIYSLGILMYEVLTGEAPFQHDDMLQLLQMHVRKDLPPLQEINPDLPEALNYPLQQATLKDPKARYASVLDFAQDFHAVISNISASKTTTIPFPSIRERDLVDPAEVRNPYKGLKAFQESDADDFFGRDTLVQSLKNSIADSTPNGRFLAVVGPSGSGKSSVVRAGLIPSIRNSEIKELPPQYITTMIPGSQPMRSLEGAILKVASRATVKLMETISQDTYDLNDVLKNALPEDGEMLLLIDQFEEIFTLIRDESVRLNFLNIIYETMMADDSRLRVIATLRADFLHMPLLYPEWGTLFRERMELIPAMNSSDLRSAIEDPAIQAGLTFESGLSGLIVADVNEQKGVLPLLQYTLSELYERRNGIELTTAAYQEIGGISGALAKRANEIFMALKPEQRDVSRLIFTRLVRVGERQDHTRQRVLLGDIYSLDREENVLRSTVDTFGKYRLLTFDNEASTRAPTIEVAHEALIRSWDRLRDWINDNADALRLQARLADEALLWSTEGRDASYLATGLRLQQFATLHNNDIIALTLREQEYLEASLAHDELRIARAKRIQLVFRVLTAAIFIAGIIAIILAFVANYQRIEAEIARALADSNAQESRARELAASSLLYAETRPDTAILLALESIGIQNTFEGRNALLSGLLTQNRLAGYFDGHDSFVRTIALSEDGSLLATGGQDGSVFIWDTASHTALVSRDLHSNRVNVVSFNPDATQLVSAGAEGEIFVLDVATGETIQDLSVDEEEVRAARFSPDGESLVIGNSSGHVVRWSTEDYSQTGEANAHNELIIYDLEFSPDGSTMVTGGSDNTIHFWNADDLSVEAVLPAHTEAVLSLAFSPDGELLASGSVDRSVRVWRTDTRESVWALAAHQDEVFALTFSDDGRFVISGALDDFVIIWDVAAAGVRSSFATFGRTGVRALADYNNSLYIAGNTSDVVEVNIGFVPRFGTVIETTPEDILTTAVHPDGRIAYAGGDGEDFAIYILEADGETVSRLDFHTDRVTDLAWSNNRLISASGDRRVAVHEDGELLGLIPGQFDALSVAAYDNLVALGTQAGIIALWDLSADDADSWSLLTLLEGHETRVNDLDFSADGTRLVSGDLAGTIRLWNIETASEITDTPLTGHTNSVETVMFSPDASMIASGGRDGNIILWDSETGEMLGPPLVRHENWVTGLAFSPDGERMVSVSGDSSLILWNTRAQRAIGLPFIGHSDWVNTVSYSPDGTYVVSGGRDGNLFHWDVTLDTWIDTACDIVKRDLTEGEIRDFFSEAYPPLGFCSNVDSNAHEGDE